jgi:hypothetical protein
VNDPIDNMIWRPSATLNANHYNPNVVFTPELKLLEHSILESGWIFPIVISSSLIIIDGFHRWRLSQDSRAMQERWFEEVPTVMIECSDAEAMMITIRMNRAKGTHVAVRMSSVIQSLVIDHGLTVEEIGKGIGAKKDEVLLLMDGDIFKHRKLDKYQYSKAWIPIKVTPEERERLLKAKDAAAIEVAEREDSVANDEVG